VKKQATVFKKKMKWIAKILLAVARQSSLLDEFTWTLGARRLYSKVVASASPNIRSV
jgi:hypothetical protein